MFQDENVKGFNGLSWTEHIEMEEIKIDLDLGVEVQFLIKGINKKHV